MKLTDALVYCMSKPGAREDYPFGPEPLVVKVGTKIFAFLWQNESHAGLSLKCEPETAYLLRQQYAAVKPGYHLNKRHWNSVTLDGTIPDEEIRAMIDESYALVVRGLTRAEKEALAALQP
jgi:predicted DNA-binding protein (MmcQ/YjbR family)